MLFVTLTSDANNEPFTIGLDHIVLISPDPSRNPAHQRTMIRLNSFKTPIYARERYEDVLSDIRNLQFSESANL